MLLHASISWLFFSGRAAWLPHPYFYHPVPHIWCVPPPSKSSPVPSAWEGHRHCHRMPGASGGSGECPAAGTPWLSGC